MLPTSKTRNTLRLIDELLLPRDPPEYEIVWRDVETIDPNRVRDDAPPSEPAWAWAFDGALVCGRWVGPPGRRQFEVTGTLT